MHLSLRLYIYASANPYPGYGSYSIPEPVPTPDLRSPPDAAALLSFQFFPDAWSGFSLAVSSRPAPTHREQLRSCFSFQLAAASADSGADAVEPGGSWLLVDFGDHARFLDCDLVFPPPVPTPESAIMHGCPPHDAAGGTTTTPSQSSTSTMVMACCFLLDELPIAAIAVISINKQLYFVDGSISKLRVPCSDEMMAASI